MLHLRDVYILVTDVFALFLAKNLNTKVLTTHKIYFMDVGAKRVQKVHKVLKAVVFVEYLNLYLGY